MILDLYIYLVDSLPYSMGYYFSACPLPNIITVYIYKIQSPQLYVNEFKNLPSPHNNCWQINFVFLGKRSLLVFCLYFLTVEKLNYTPKLWLFWQLLPSRCNLVKEEKRSFFIYFLYFIYCFFSIQVEKAV